MKPQLKWALAGLLVGSIALAPVAAQSEYIRQIAGGMLFGTGNSQAVLFGNDGKGYIKVDVGGAVTLINGATLAAFAPADATYITQTSAAGLSAEQVLASLSSGIMRVATTTGAITALTTSVGISGNISDETGSGALVFGTGPTIVAPAGATSTGLMITKSARFVEAAAATSYTATVAIPAGATIHSITLIAEVLWNGTSATAKIGDSVDDDGFFTGVNLKATDLLVGEILSIRESSLWGGKEGAYLVAADGRRGPVATNFGLYYAAGSSITCIITPGAADGTLGRTVFSVTYSVGEVLTVVVV